MKPGHIWCRCRRDFVFNFLAAPCGMQDSSSPMHQPVLPAVETPNLNQWATREVWRDLS